MISVSLCKNATISLATIAGVSSVIELALLREVLEFDRGQVTGWGNTRCVARDALGRVDLNVLHRIGDEEPRFIHQRIHSVVVGLVGPIIGIHRHDAVGALFARS